MKILPYLIFVAVLALIGLSVFYLSNTIIFIFGIEHTRPIYISAGLLPVIFLVCIGLFINTTGIVGHIIYKIVAIAMGVYLFLVLSFLLVDAINLFIKIIPATFGLIGFVLAFIVSIYGYWNGANIKITSYSIPIEGLTKKVKAVHLSDIHIGHFRTIGFLKEIIDKTNGQKPDVVFFTGDFLDSQYALKEKFFDPLKKINAPIFFVDGNHDYSTNRDKIVALLKQVGVTVLENEKSISGELQIVGLNHMIADRNSFDMHASEHNPTIDETLQKIEINRDKPSILLHHAPNGIKYAQMAGIDLYLTGHTHAGQIFPFSLISKLLFEFNRGLHKYKDTKIIVSEGIGTFGPPFRIGTKSEIISLDLLPA